MASNLSSLIETIVSLFVDIGGNGAKHGGKGLLMAGARKIGWSSGGGGGHSRGRFGGHSISGHRLGSGGGGVSRQSLNNYRPAEDYKQRSSEGYKKGMRSGSGMGGSYNPASQPTSLFGRSSFDNPGSATGRGSSSRWIKGGAHGRGGSYTPRPRSFIRF